MMNKEVVYVPIHFGVRQSLEQKVGLSPTDPAFRYQTDKDQRASEPVPSRMRFLREKTHLYHSVPECGESPGPSLVYFNSTVTLPILPANLLSRSL